MTAVPLARVHAFGGAKAMADALAAADSQLSAEYLSDSVNWISYDETIALLRAGARVMQMRWRVPASPTPSMTSTAAD